MPDFESGVASYITGKQRLMCFSPLISEVTQTFVAINATISGETIKRAD